MTTINEFNGHVNASKDSIMVDAKSVLGIASLGFGIEFDIELITVSEDEMVKFMNEMRRFRV
jgi:phosphotransferase system HPr-like phosphotransfer protein